MFFNFSLTAFRCLLVAQADYDTESFMMLAFGVLFLLAEAEIELQHREASLLETAQVCNP